VWRICPCGPGLWSGLRGIGIVGCGCGCGHRGAPKEAIGLEVEAGKGCGTSASSNFLSSAN